MYLYQPPNGYCYNSDSIFLYDFISRQVPRGKMLDVGCGVGIISLLLTRDFAVDTTVIDKQRSMIEYAGHNFALNGLEAETILGDFVMHEFDHKFDLVVSNPPFYHPDVTQSLNTHLNIARYAHHLPFDAFVTKVKRVLHPRGRFIFCYDAKQIDMLLATLRAHKLNVETLEFIHSKVDRPSKLVMIAARAGSRSMTTVLPPFVVFGEDGEYTPRAAKAFERAGTHSIKGDRETKEQE